MAGISPAIVIDIQEHIRRKTGVYKEVREVWDTKEATMMLLS